MAIDRNQTRSLVNGINELFDVLPFNLSDTMKDLVKRTVMGPALEELKRLVDDSQPPVLLLAGRTGHGKSSIINALANKHVAETDPIKPQTPEAKPYTIHFQETYSTWDVIDTRGIFETTKPDGALEEDAVKALKDSIREHRPDVIMHVVSAPEVRGLSNDRKVFGDILKEIKQETGTMPPTIFVINRVDTLDDPRDWPPEKSPRKAGLIKNLLDYAADEVLKVQTQKIDLNFPIKGYEVLRQANSESCYVGIIPVCALENAPWNVETLSEFVGQHLPETKLLDFFQAQRRQGMLKKVSSNIIKRFSATAAGIGAVPIPVADILVLTPLQLLMIGIVGGLSCKPFSEETVKEYLSAAGLNVGAAVGLREAARQVVKLIPVGGSFVSGAVAGSATYGIGKAAEAYFFSGEVKDPHKLGRGWVPIIVGGASLWVLLKKALEAWQESRHPQPKPSFWDVFFRSSSQNKK